MERSGLNIEESKSFGGLDTDYAFAGRLQLGVPVRDKMLLLIQHHLRK